MKRLFGTDGIRGVAGDTPLDAPTVRRFGAALAVALARNGQPARLLLGRDTRESGPWLRDAVAAGLRSQGATAIDSGVVTTPGLAWCVAEGEFDGGVMISASHNPFADNGLKAFDGRGMKLSDEIEQQIEAWILDGDGADPGEAEEPVVTDEALVRHYVHHLRETVAEGRLDGMRICIDCANGSASALATELFESLGADVIAIGTAPDGRNINLDCGSLHLDKLSDRVKAEGADVGLAFDGDADRCLAVDGEGRIVDGDHILFITGVGLKRAGRLRGDGLVATIMSNFWLEERLTQEGITLHRASVGDKYVLERMIAEGLVLGGEQSGHLIFLDRATTGDGMLTGLLLLDTLVDHERSLDEIIDSIEPYPQQLINVAVREKPDLRAHPQIGPVVAEVEKALEGMGRVVLRYSGTEKLARVMVEGKDPLRVRSLTEQLADRIRAEIGA